MNPHRSAEREREGLHTRIEELNLEQSIGDGLRLSDQLIKPLLGDRAVPLVVHVDAMSSAGWLSIDEHAKAHGTTWSCRSHHKMQIAGVETIRDPPAGLVQSSGPLLHGPVA